MVLGRSIARPGVRSSSAYRLSISILVGAAVVSTASAQQEETSDAFGRSVSQGQSAQPEWIQRARDLEQRFFDANDWSFYQSVDALPRDLRTVLFRVASETVVDAGESFDQTDISVHGSSSQHLYTAVTGNTLGVIVWYAGGWNEGVHVLIYDRSRRDACHYNIGSGTGPVLPLRTTLHMWVEMRGVDHGGCNYLSPGFTSDER